MTPSSQAATDLAPAPRIPQVPHRPPGISVYPTPDGINMQVDRQITAGELGHHLALLVPAAARLDSAEVDEDGDIELRFAVPIRLP